MNKKKNKEGLRTARKENEDLKDKVIKEEQRVREEVIGEMKTWKIEHERASVNLKELIEKRKEKKMEGR